MEKINSYPSTSNIEQRRSTMNGFPAKVVALFAALAMAGTVMVAIADRLAGGFHQTVMAAMGSAIFGGGLAFFLIETFRWAHDRNTENRQ